MNSRSCWVPPLFKRYKAQLTVDLQEYGPSKHIRIMSQVVLPLVLAFLLVIAPFPLDFSSGCLTFISVSASVMCAVAALLFQVRSHDVREDKRLTELDFQLVDFMFTLSVWSVVVDLSLLLLILAPHLIVFDFLFCAEILSVCRKFVLLCLGIHQLVLIVTFVDYFVKAYARIAEHKPRGEV